MEEQQNKDQEQEKPKKRRKIVGVKFLDDSSGVYVYEDD